MTRRVQTQLTEARVREIRHWFANVSDDALATDVIALADAYLAQQRVIEAARTVVTGLCQFSSINGVDLQELHAAVSVGSPETRETEE